MRSMAKLLGPVVLLLGVAACAGANDESKGATQMQPANAHCRAAGDQCRWDNQCCSGRCYVDTGCSG